MNQVSDRLAALAPSQTLAMSQKSSELKAQGVDVINLSVTELLMFISNLFAKSSAQQASILKQYEMSATRSVNNSSD